MEDCVAEIDAPTTDIAQVDPIITATIQAAPILNKGTIPEDTSLQTTGRPQHQFQFRQADPRR